MGLKAVTLGAAFLVAPMAAGAATVTGSFVQANTDLSANPTPTVVGNGNLIADAGDLAVSEAWKFTALGPLRLGGTGTVNGFSAFEQPLTVSYSTDGGAGGVFATAAFGPVFADTQGFLLPSITLAAGDEVYVLVEYVGASESFADIDFRLSTTVVPVPAAGLMLMSALLGVALLRRRSAWRAA